jgi:hypothetical protein
MQNHNKEKIVKSFKKVFNTNDISHLSKDAYNFIYLASGFIAHYDHAGFKDYYSDVKKFKNDIIANQKNNQWKNFRPGERDYEYYMNKKDIYNAIVDLLNNPF